MQSNAIYQVIEKIAADSSKNGKQAIIEAMKDEPEFLRVLKAALDPFITYGIGKDNFPKVAGQSGQGNFDDSTWLMLNNLSSRALSGNAARAAITEALTPMNTESRLLLQNIITKDLRAGFSESTVNKAIPGLITTFECMLAHPFSEHKHKLPFPLMVEPKLDGVRVLTFVNLLTNEVKFFSRSGKEFTTFEHLKKPTLRMVELYRSRLMSDACDEYDAMGLPDGEDTDTAVLDELYNKHGVDEALELVLDSEVVSGQFNKTVSDVRKKDSQATDARLAVFDLLPIITFNKEDKKGCEVAGVYSVRRKRVEALLNCMQEGDPFVKLPVFTVNSEEEIHTLYEKVRARGMEGLIIKDPNGLYHRRRNHAWTKIKAEESVDIVIVDCEEGTGKYEGMLGALICDFKGVYVNVGSGFSDQQRKDFWESYLIQKRDFGPTSDLDHEIVGRMIEVEYHEITPDGSLRHPRFKRFRDDKA